ncbi:lipopolysaccharide biosynthesis protein [uncultured Dubosiella sp.]|uniref:lipopolysaccharide biosynthesis protein n=2 Tax=uncultured Dubosiella sp. TaxID=1937011 RepID=UPI00266F1308|nr:hypothetical protein [uncultured Dubosiella sp.]
MEKSNISRSVIYNTIGTFFYFFCQWLTTILVVRISGYEDAGILSIVISFTNIFYFIALFGVRNFQVTDINHEFTDRDYLNSRHITSGIALILFVISLFCMRFSQVTVICCILYMIFKVFEGYTDVIFGIWQNHDGYFEILVSYIGKGILTIAGFCIGLYLFNLPIAIAIQALLYFLFIALYDGNQIKKLVSDFEVKTNQYKKMLIPCVPLMIYGLIVPYLNFLSRYVVELKFGTEILGYYSSITMVFTVMSTLMGSVFVTVLPKIAYLYQTGNYKELNKFILLANLGIVGFGAVCVGLGIALGNFVFSILFGKQILDYMYLLTPTIIASIILSLVSLTSSIMISFRKNHLMLMINTVGVVLCTLSISFIVDSFGLVGALYALIISLSFIYIGLLVIIEKIVKKKGDFNGKNKKICF